MAGSFREKMTRTAGQIAGRLGEAAQTANERLGEMREIQRINQEIRALQRERDRCRFAMADLLMRMFDQNTFAEALLRPEYNRIREIDTEIAKLEVERDAVGREAQAEQMTPTAVPPAHDEPVVTPPPPVSGDQEVIQSGPVVYGENIITRSDEDLEE